MNDWLRRWAAGKPRGRRGGRARSWSLARLMQPRWLRGRRIGWPTVAAAGAVVVLLIAVLALRSPHPQSRAVAVSLPPKPAPASVAAAMPSPSAEPAPAVSAPAVAPAPPTSSPTPAAPPPAQAAMVMPPAGVAPEASRPPPAVEPAWLRYAVSAPPADGRARIAIIIDDLGLDRRRTARTIALKGPVTLSFLAYAEDLPQQTAAAREAGHELLVHVPMEPINRAIDMGPNGLKTSLSPEELDRRLRWDLARFQGYVGINNHMGSRFTEDAVGMETVLEELKARGLLFVDSRTIGNSVGARVAHRLGVPYAVRNVFLDDDTKLPAIMARLSETEAIARRHGTAIAIGHPHDTTLEALQEWLPTLPQKGFELVPVSAIVKARLAQGTRAASAR